MARPRGKPHSRARGFTGGGVIATTLQLTSATIADTAAIGDTIGTLSVSNGSGSYTYSLTDSASGKVSITGNALKVAAALSAGSFSITIQANNGAGSTPSRSFLITVTHNAVARKSTFYILGL